MAAKVSDFVLSRLREWASTASSPIRATPSTACSPHGAGRTTIPSSCRHGTRRWPPSRRLREVHRPVGVCAATSGPGAIRLLNGLYDAKPDQVPVVAIVGQASRSAMGGSYQPEIDLLTLYRDVAS